jgi:integrase
MASRPYQANRALAVLRKVLSLAVKEWELRTDNPALGFKMFREKRRERHVTDAELRIIGPWLAKVEREGTQPAGAILVTRLLALTGMRLGEVLFLDRRQVDLRERSIRLEDAKAGPRTVPLPTPAMVLLSEAMNSGANQAGQVALDFDGSPLTVGRYRTFWSALRAETGIADIRPHDFRHGAATFGAQLGANAFLLQHFMGHKTLAMTGGYVERVVDPIRELSDKIASRVSTALDGTPAGEVVPLRRSAE